jgi:hypothetical protein
VADDMTGLNEFQALNDEELESVSGTVRLFWVRHAFTT